MCQAQNECWRWIYTRYLLAHGYADPPTRDLLLFEGYAPVAIMPNGGIFAETMPLPGRTETLCPFQRGLGNVGCHEFEKWRHRHERDNRPKRFPNQQPRPAIPKELRRLVAARARYKCEYCGAAQNSFRLGTKVQCVVDHFVALAVGGSPTDPTNLVFSCRECNREKGVSVWKRGQKLLQR
mgnify:CR=1 FL=1